MSKRLVFISTLVMLSIFSVKVFSQQVNSDSVAIVKLLEKAATTFRAGDTKAYANCWLVRPYSIILISTADGKAMSIPAEAMAHPSSHAGQGGYATASNYKMSIHGDNGWTSFDEVSTAKDGAKSYSHEVWMVEKVNNEWKLVAASMHFYKPS
ncbi:MAG TPA: hypothetical protein VKR32_13395 [Puia sp.]|nr:hypothetical protein [Puia sp.]